MVEYITLKCEKLPTGDTLITGLRDGYLKADKRMREAIQDLSDEGGLWPYELILLRTTDKGDDIWLCREKQER